MYVGKVPDSIQNFRPRRRVTINRPIYTEEDVGALTTQNSSSKETFFTDTMSKWASKKAMDCTCSSLGHRLLSFFPCLFWLREYKRKYIFKDLVAGFTLGVFQIPQGKNFWTYTVRTQRCFDVYTTSKTLEQRRVNVENYVVFCAYGIFRLVCFDY